MTELTLPPTNRFRRPAMFEDNTGLVRRNLLVGVAARRPDDVVAMVSRARARGISYRDIAAWLGPRVSCPPELHALRDRLELFASLETE